MSDSDAEMKPLLDGQGDAWTRRPDGVWACNGADQHYFNDRFFVRALKHLKDHKRRPFQHLYVQWGRGLLQPKPKIVWLRRSMPAWRGTSWELVHFVTDEWIVQCAKRAMVLEL